MPGVTGKENLGFHQSAPIYSMGQLGGPEVDYERDEVKALKPLWITVSDCIDGQSMVKSKGEVYLPKPNKSDLSTQNADRYKQYVTRSVFYNVTARTLYGLVGEVFSKEAELTVPASLEPMVEDIDGGGVSLEQQAKKVLAHVLSYGRVGLLVDYPTTTGVTTVLEQEEGGIRPTATIYRPWDVINWRTRLVGAESRLSLVVLRESYTIEDDGFKVEQDTQYRVLLLDEANVYTVQIWRADAERQQWSIVEEFNPARSDGQPWDEIPFVFVGIENNDVEPDNPPLLDLANLNVGHYRNSADYEEASFIAGQPTLWISGVSEEWVNGPMKGKVNLGSRGGIPLPVGGSAGLLQVAPNILPKEAMDHKERQMVALGARLVQQGEVQRTATEATMESASETSVLGSAARNVSNAYGQVLVWMGAFAGVDGDHTYELSTDFHIYQLDATMLTALMSAYQATGLSWTELRDNLRRANLTSLTDEEAKDENEQDLTLNPPEEEQPEEETDNPDDE